MTSRADALGTVMVGSGGATPAVTTFGNAGLVWNDPAAWLLDHVVAVIAVSNITKRIRHMGAFPEQPIDEIASDKKVPSIDRILLSLPI
jgi:hypothetical protein